MAETTFENLVDTLLDRQSQSWLAGNRPSIEDMLQNTPLGDDTEAWLDLIYNEIVLREELGERPDAEEYAQRFPNLRDEIVLHFEVHSAIDDPQLKQTARLCEAETLSDAVVLSPLRTPELPGYEQLQPLGRGGMGVVYQARHRELRRQVALKMFEPGLLPSPREVLRFRTEASAIARLQHPNIVQIFEVGEWNGLPFLALELAEGGNLAQRLQRLPFTPRAAAELIETLASAVYASHEQGIIHRDLKPANILFARNGTPKLTDFGLAKVLQRDTEAALDATRSGDALGTPRYMSPEQALGRHDMVRVGTDIYGLGNVLYECLTGQVPFVSPSVLDTLEKIRSEEPTSPRRFQPAIPRDLETICLKCLRKAPEQRYLSAQALAEDLRRFLDGMPIHARPMTTRERLWKWCRRKPTRAALIAVGIVLLVGRIGAGIVWEHNEQKRIAKTRIEIESLISEGQTALQGENDTVAEEKFNAALLRVRSEPKLRDFELGVSGLLDHSRRAKQQQLWIRRGPPRTFDEKRDDALFHGLLLVPPGGTDPLRTAREAVADALALTLPNDPAWRRERERLVVFEAILIRWESGAAKALAHLDALQGPFSRLIHAQRAALLDELGRSAEAIAARRSAEQFPPDEVTCRLFAGIEQFHRGEFVAAGRDFEAVLDLEPAHFPARLLQALCALAADEPAQAKVGLTACIAQRPRFAWSYYYRGKSAEKLGDPEPAKRDFLRATQLHPDFQNR